MTTDNRAALVARIETLLEKATAGPWRVSMRGYSVKSNNDDMPIVVQNPWGTSMRERDIPRWLDNAELIAATPELLRDVLSLLTAEPERPTVADHYGHGWQAGVSSVSTCRQCGQFLNHGHACVAEPERPTTLSEADAARVLELQKIPSEEFWKVYDDLRDIGKLASGVSKFVDRVANLIPDAPKPKCRTCDAETTGFDEQGPICLDCAVVKASLPGAEPERRAPD